MTVEEIKDKYSMKDILGMYGLTVGRGGFICCPFHDGDRDPSLKVYQKDFYCFGCGASGDIFSFVQMMDNLTFQEAFRRLGNIIGMAHPAYRHRGNLLKQKGGLIYLHLGLSILADRSGGYLSAQLVCHQLGAIADAQDRNTQIKNRLINVGGFLQIYAVGTAGKDDALGIHFFNGLQRHSIGVHFAVDIAFADTAGNQLIILTAEVQNNNHLSVHGKLLFL